LFDGHVGVQVDLRGLDLLVAEPERDDRKVHPGVEQLHRRSVAQDVGRDGVQARGGCVLGDEPFDRVTAKPGAGAGREERLIWFIAATFVEPVLQHFHGLLVQRGAAMLSAFAEAHVGAAAEVHVGSVEVHQFRDSQPGADGEQEQGMVASAGPGEPVRCGQEGLYLGVGEVGDEGFVEASRRDRQHPLDERGMLGVAERGELEQGVDRGETGVAGAHAVAPLELEMVQERGDEGGVEVDQAQRGWWLRELLLREGQQQLHRVAVGRDRVGAGGALADQTVGEERLHGRGQRRGHDVCLTRSSRCKTACMSSGVAVRYQ
jgi:hypothetical protein